MNMTPASAPHCPVCDGAEQAFEMTARGHDLYRCGTCATIYVHGLPSNAEVATGYDDSYDGATTGYFAKVDKKMRRSRGRIRSLKKLVGAGARFLDVGCNGGFVVEAAREAGLDAWGLEVDGVSLAHAREHYPKNNYFLGLVEDFQPDQGFDLIYTSEVIEHVSDVRPFMAAIVRLLNPGGVVYVTTPDISHWRRPRDLDRWDGFNPPVHCVYFNPASMRVLLESLGLQVVKKLPAFKPGMKFIARKPG
ncbi:MAG: class I SAM-dependent methyltransferase [Rhodospirillales bacterium]|tara:strand:+ start:433 stop:1179 length:747 start_codon:yes stop_codon:yes gene_type:complete